LWRSNIAVDRKLPWGFSSTTEYLYNRDVNGTYYINANQPVPQSAFTGADMRPRWIAPAGTVATRLAANQNVIDAVVLKNESSGVSWNFAQSVQKTFNNGIFIKAAYSYGEAKNIVDAGSIAFGSWQANAVPTNLNTPPIAFSGASPGHRFFVAGAYTREYFKLGQTTMSVFYDQHTQGNTSYVFSGDANGDTGTGNDLLYIPRSQSEMNFQSFAAGGVTFTPAQQAAAWDAYISQDAYLSAHRGEYAQRGAVFFPLVKRMDLSLQQNLFRDFSGARHAFAVRLDMLNVGNLLNHDWGVGYRIVSNSPLTNPAADANGALGYRLRVINGALMDHTFEHTSSLTDVYTFMVTLKYSFR
jgi:hypothetical protein